jgi:prepilin-type processing-associated H-X9-DG protein
MEIDQSEPRTLEYASARARAPLSGFPYWSLVFVLAGITVFLGFATRTTATNEFGETNAMIGCVPGAACGIIAAWMGWIGIRHTAPNGRGRAPAVLGAILGVLESAFLILLLVGAVADENARNKAARERSNIREIGMALIIYAYHDPDHAFPPDLLTLATRDNLPPDIFVSPIGNDTPARSISQLLQGGHLSYVYTGAGSKSDSSDDVVMYEPLAMRHGEGSEMLFADGHVEYLKYNEAEPIIRAAQKGVHPLRRWAILATQPSTRP